MPAHIIPNVKAGNDRGEVPATNPYKAAWASGAFLSFAAAGWMLRHLQHEETRLAPLEAIAQQQQEAIADFSARTTLVDAYREVTLKQAELEAEVELVRHEHLVRLGHAELLGTTELAIAQLEAEEIKFDAQTAGLTEAQKQDYIEFLRKVETPYLTGQTIQDIANPADKVTAAPTEAIAEESPNPPAKPTDDLEFEITRLNPPDPTKGKNYRDRLRARRRQNHLRPLQSLEPSSSLPDIQVYDLDDGRQNLGQPARLGHRRRCLSDCRSDAGRQNPV